MSHHLLSTPAADSLKSPFPFWLITQWYENQSQSKCTLKRIDVVFVTRIPIPNVQGQYFWWAICIDSNCAAIKAKNCIRNSAKNGSSQFQAPWDFLNFFVLANVYTLRWVKRRLCLDYKLFVPQSEKVAKNTFFKRCEEETLCKYWAKPLRMKISHYFCKSILR